MRIIAGEYKSRKIEPPAGVNIRPTSDRVKEALFNILGPRVIGKRVLDLFSGSGNLGIEALSRGAKSCVFVDNNQQCIRTIKSNLTSLGIEGNENVVLKDALKFIKDPGGDEGVFDIIFVDPPYYKDIVKNSLILLDNYNIISALTIVIAEHHRRDDVPQSEELKKIELFRQERYGGTILSFYKGRRA